MIFFDFEISKFSDKSWNFKISKSKESDIFHKDFGIVMLQIHDAAETVCYKKRDGNAEDRVLLFGGSKRIRTFLEFVETHMKSPLKIR